MEDGDGFCVCDVRRKRVLEASGQVAEGSIVPEVDRWKDETEKLRN